MPNKQYESKKRWNAAHYKQLNISASPELIEAFRATCEQNGNSMRKVLTEFMASYAATPPDPKQQKNMGYNERKHRRKAVETMAVQLAMICEAESSYKENMPDNLKNSSRYEAAEQTVEILEEAMELLGGAFA